MAWILVGSRSTVGAAAGSGGAASGGSAAPCATVTPSAACAVQSRALAGLGTRALMRRRRPPRIPGWTVASTRTVGPSPRRRCPPRIGAPPQLPFAMRRHAGGLRLRPMRVDRHF
eukprot:61833-Pyramimonas_sp.AAC.1